MNFLIVEDEEEAAKRLRRMLSKLSPKAFVHGPVESVDEAVKWLETNPAPDLIFLDIHLSDGLSFSIFERVKCDVAVICTTAYDQYALKAFKLNSIDYLLKPIEEEGLVAALEKFNSRFLQSPSVKLGSDWHKMLAGDYGAKYKTRFVTRIGERIVAIETADVLYAFSEDKATYLCTTQGKNHLVDFSLEQLEAMLDPMLFFRLNRKYLARYESIAKMLAYSNSRMKIELRDCKDADIVLSRERTRDFKEWLDR
jgi:DNA-binding LytR/AlgR family response regulator